VTAWEKSSEADSFLRRSQTAATFDFGRYRDFSFFDWGVSVFGCFGTQDPLIRSTDRIKDEVSQFMTNETDLTDLTGRVGNFRLEISSAFVGLRRDRNFKRGATAFRVAGFRRR